MLKKIHFYFKVQKYSLSISMEKAKYPHLGNILFPKWGYYGFNFLLRSVKKSCWRICENLYIISEFKSAFSNILYTLERWQCKFLAIQAMLRPCSSTTCLIIFPTWTSCIFWEKNNRELCLFDSEVLDYLIIQIQKAHDMHVSISTFFLDDSWNCRDFRI